MADRQIVLWCHWWWSSEMGRKLQKMENRWKETYDWALIVLCWMKANAGKLVTTTTIYIHLHVYVKCSVGGCTSVTWQFTFKPQMRGTRKAAVGENIKVTAFEDRRSFSACFSTATDKWCLFDSCQSAVIRVQLTSSASSVISKAEWRIINIVTIN